MLATDRYCKTVFNIFTFDTAYTIKQICNDSMRFYLNFNTFYVS